MTVGEPIEGIGSNKGVWMDTEVLTQNLRAQFEVRLEAALSAAQKAPDGQWIAASEWEIHAI
jgi:hypothetical protein